MNDKAKKAVRALQNASGYIVIFFVCAIYILTALIDIGDGHKTIEQIITDSAVIFILGITVNRMAETQGMINGKNDEQFIRTQNLHSDTVLRVAPMIDKLDEWCAIKNAENLKDQRIKLLAAKGMRYDDYFGEGGKPYEVDEKRIKNKYTRKNELERKATYEKALNIRLTPLTAGAMTTDAERPDDPYRMGRTRAQYERNQSIADVMSRICVAAVLGYYSVHLIDNFTWESLIWNAFQVGIFLVSGVVQMQRAYLFITDEYRQNIVKKIDNLNKFEGWANKPKINEEAANNG